LEFPEILSEIAVITLENCLQNYLFPFPVLSFLELQKGFKLQPDCTDKRFMKKDPFSS
jgi:hypothetical protein